MKKTALFPIEYDEISLVDAGGGESDDGSIGPRVLIMKRDVSKAYDGPSGRTRLVGEKRRRITSGIDRNIVTSRWTVNRDVSRTLKRKRKAASDPCGGKTNSTGAKETDSSKKSKRAKNFKEERHKRDKNGRMAKTSQASKDKYGKGGTTKAKQDAECRKRKVRKQAADFIVKSGSAMSRFETDARLRAKMERKLS